MNADEARLYAKCSEQEREALHIISHILGNLTIIERRLTKIGSTVPVEGADADIVVQEAARLREVLHAIEAARKGCPDCGGGYQGPDGYIPHNDKCPAVAS